MDSASPTRLQGESDGGASKGECASPALEVGDLVWCFGEVEAARGVGFEVEAVAELAFSGTD